MSNHQIGWSDLNKLYLEDKLSPYQIAELKDCTRDAVYEALDRLGIPRRSKSEARILAIQTGRYIPKDQKLANNSRWKGGIRLHPRGYIEVKAPEHHRAHTNGYVYEHILIWEQTHNQQLPEGWHVHHVNGIRSDNRPQNLVALPPAKHRIKHKSISDIRKQRIRELEAEVRLLQRALEDNQLIFHIGEN